MTELRPSANRISAPGVYPRVRANEFCSAGCDTVGVLPSLYEGFGLPVDVEFSMAARAITFGHQPNSLSGVTGGCGDSRADGPILNP